MTYSSSLPLFVSPDHSRTIVALNNAGVTLLEKGHAAQALHVWQALQGQQAAGAVVQRAMDWVQQPANDIFVMDVHVLNDHDSLALTDAVLYGPSSSMVFCLRLSLSDKQHTASYYSAVTLYNYAMACRCVYAETDNITHLQRAQQALVYASLLTAQSTWLNALTDCALERVMQEQQRHEYYQSCSSKSMDSEPTRTTAATSTTTPTCWQPQGQAV